MKASDKISFNDGKLEAQVLEVLGEEIKVKFLEEGVITAHSSVRVPSRALKDLPVLQAQDVADINDIAVKNRFDFIAIPGIVSAKDLQEVRRQV